MNFSNTGSLKAVIASSVMVHSFLLLQEVNCGDVRIPLTSINKYKNPSFATMSQGVLLITYITTCFGLYPSHRQVLSYTEY
jgi:hypothetical protein